MNEAEKAITATQQPQTKEKAPPKMPNSARENVQRSEIRLIRLLKFKRMTSVCRACAKHPGSLPSGHQGTSLWSLLPITTTSGGILPPHWKYIEGAPHNDVQYYISSYLFF